MTQKFPLPTTGVQISVRTGGDCTIQGSTEHWIETGEDSDEINLFVDENIVRVTSGSDCAIVVPMDASLFIERVGGDVEISQIHGEVKVEVISGDLRAEDLGALIIEKVGGDADLDGVTGDVSIGRVSGDFAVERVSGQFRMRKCGGDFSLVDVDGPVYFETVGGDASITDVMAGVQGSVGGDASLRIRAGQEGIRENIYVNAGGDIACELVGEMNASVRLGSSGRRIRVVTGGHEQLLRALIYQLNIGGGKTQIALNAGGDIDLVIPNGEAHPAGAWGEPGRADRSQLRDEIRHTVEQSIRGAMLTDEMASKLEQKTKAAAERARVRIEDALRRMDFPPAPVAPQTWTEEAIITPPPPPAPPEPPSMGQPASEPVTREPVTDEERLMVLRMVQEKKISIEQAEQLLEALDAQES